MAEFDGLDSRLRDAFAKAAEQGDSTGVADAIRSRIAAGDPGTSVAASTAPGWGGGAFSWMPWLGLIVVGALVGGAVGVSGAAGRPAGGTVVDVPVSIGESAPAHSCVDGPVIGRIAANTRVLAVQRSDDSLWVGVRDPDALGSTVWVALGDVSLDDGTPALEVLPVGGACPQVVVVTPTPEPPPPPVDTTRPVISKASATSPFFSVNQQSTTITATATDNVGVTRVSIQIVRPDGVAANAEMQNAGGTWSYVYTPGPNSGGLFRFVLTAYDAAGNAATAEVSVLGT